MARITRATVARTRAPSASFGRAVATAAPALLGYGAAAGSSLAVSLIALPLLRFFDLVNIVMLFMLSVVLVAARFGRGPAMASAFLNVLAFDFFFVPPRLSYAVIDGQYLLTFAVMVIVGLIVGQLTAALRQQAEAASYRERRAVLHYELAQALANASSKSAAIEVGRRSLEAAFHARTELLLPDAASTLVLATPRSSMSGEVDLSIAQWTFDHAEPSGYGTLVHSDADRLYVPLRATARTEGVLVVDARGSRSIDTPAQRRLLYTFVALMAGATERLHLLAVAQEAQVAVESERLRNSILAALSHDLRTPLTALIGLSDMLGRALVREGSSQVGQAGAITERLIGTSALVANLLDMARFETGNLSVRREWQSLEEIADGAIRSVEGALSGHVLRASLPQTLPLLYGDAVLLERVLANLFENAAKYTPAGTEITLSAWRAEEHIVIQVSDRGPGLPTDDIASLFEKFQRGARESSTSGVGLGLSICRAIARAHGGDIEARNRPWPDHGAIVTWNLPHRDSPAVLDLPETTPAPASASAYA